MNIQQVKGEVGDGEEDITAESLTKYEKAAKDLGVALKEVKDGVAVLRDPMAVLNDLAEAFNKEADDSIKKANLINAIGGKYRGNQLSALLSNWDTYKEILETYNSDLAIGSSLRESQKDVESWSGQVNILKNNWDELINSFIGSKTATNTLKGLSAVLNAITSASKHLGGLGTLGTIIAGIAGAKGTTLFRSGLSKTDVTRLKQYNDLLSKGYTQSQATAIALNGASRSAKQLAASANGAAVSAEVLAAAENKLSLSARAAALGQSLLNKALNITANMAIIAGISLVINQISKLINKRKEAKKAAQEAAERQQENINSAYQAIGAYNDEKQSIDDLTSKYVQLYTSTSNVSSVKEELMKVQDELCDKYGVEANSIDLVNGKLSEQIELIQKAKEEEDKKWQRENQSNIKDAKDYIQDVQNSSVLSFAYSGKDYKRVDEAQRMLSEARGMATQLMRELERRGLSEYFTISESGKSGKSDFQENLSKSSFEVNLDLKPTISNEDTLKALEGLRDIEQEWLDKNMPILSQSVSIDSDDLTEITDIAEKFRNALEVANKDYAITESIRAKDNSFPDEAEGKIKSYTNAIGELIRQINDTTSTSLKENLSLQVEELKGKIQDLVSENPEFQNYFNTIFDAMGVKLEDISTSSSAQLKEKFLETFNDVHKGALKNIDTIEDAMSKMLNGEGLDFDAFKTIVWDIDDKNIIKSIQQVNGQYILSQKELIKLKDTYINEQIESLQIAKKENQESKQLVVNEIAKLKGRAQGIQNNYYKNTNASSVLKDSKLFMQSDEYKEFAEINNKIKELEKSFKEFDNEIKRSDILISEYKNHMGDLGITTDTVKARIEALKKVQSQLQTETKKLETEASDRLKAQEYVIDQIIDRQEKEKEALNDELSILEEQLEVYEKQKSEIEEIVKNYDSAATAVSNVIEKEIEAIEKEKSNTEEYYNSIIDKLKEQNEEREDAIEYAQKLADLENAQNNKVRVYSSARGWEYKVDADKYNSAKNALDSYENDKEIKRLEKERDNALAPYSDRINKFKDYKDKWTNVSQEIKDEENDRLAQEILGSEWREQILNTDINILNRYQTEYRSYNGQLNSLTNNEINDIKKTIEAKKLDIQAREKQIDSWKKYKTQVQQVANDIKNTNEGYVKYIQEVALNEQSTYEQRIVNLNNFKTQYQNCITELASKNGELDSVTENIDKLTEALNSMNNLNFNSVSDIESQLAELNQQLEAMERIQERLRESSTGYGIVNSAADAELATGDIKNKRETVKYLEELLRSIRGYSSGGVNATTGLAMLHGTPSKSETIFNSNQSKKLYDYVSETPNLIADVMQKAVSLSGFSLVNLGTKSTPQTVGVSIDKMIIQTNDPADFSKQFKANIDRYIQYEYTKGQVYKN